MNSSQLFVSLFTPASDLATGDPTEEFEAVFGRRGNDTLFTFSPVADDAQDKNRDILFGDLFDNTQEEFEIVTNIAQTQQGGNPLLILERNIPSVGKDRFVLGDAFRPYYTNNGNPAELATTNLLGLNEFALLYDFNPAQDTIQLNGKPEDYLLIEVDGLQVPGVQQPFFGEAIFSLQQGLPDLVSFVISRPEVDLSFNESYFRFLGDKPPKTQEQRQVEQLGSPGIDLGLGSATDNSGNVFITGSTSGSLLGTNQGATDGWVAKYNSNGDRVLGFQIGTSGNDLAYDVATDNKGNFYVVGTTRGDLFSTKQSRDQDAWVAKYDPNGNLLWGRQFGANLNGSFSSGAFGLDTDAAGNVYLSGLGVKENQRQDIFNFPVQDDSFATKFDTNGNQQWFTEIGSFFFDESFDATVDKDGNTYLTGWTQGLVKEADPSRNLLKYDAWVAKVNPSGQTQWIQQLGSQGDGLDFAWGVDTDSQGNVYTTGWTTATFDRNGGNTPNGDPSTSYDTWVAKYRPDGSLEWVRQLGTNVDDGTFYGDLKIDSQDNIFFTGYTNGNLGGNNAGAYDAYVAKFDTAGNNQWIQQLGTPELDYGTGVSIDSNSGKLYLTGFTEGSFANTNAEAIDAWLAQFDVESGRLEKFTGSPKEAMRSDEPREIPIQNLGTNLLPQDLLPNGDNIIDPFQGVNIDPNLINPGDNFINPGDNQSNLSGLFDPNLLDSFSNSLAQTVGDRLPNSPTSNSSNPSQGANTNSNLASSGDDLLDRLQATGIDTGSIDVEKILADLGTSLDPDALAEVIPNEIL
jgi:hypothetical protein